MNKEETFIDYNFLSSVVVLSAQITQVSISYARYGITWLIGTAIKEDASSIIILCLLYVGFLAPKIQFILEKNVTFLA